MNLHQLDFPVKYGDGSGCPQELRAFGMMHALGGVTPAGTGQVQEMHHACLAAWYRKRSRMAIKKSGKGLNN